LEFEDKKRLANSGYEKENSFFFGGLQLCEPNLKLAVNPHSLLTNGHGLLAIIREAPQPQPTSFYFWITLISPFPS
jgi:hypothetical protein